MTCQHLHGDRIDDLGAWVCGQCFRILPERPTRYRLASEGEWKTAAPQQIAWQAEIRRSAEGTTLADFLRTMAKRYQRKDKSLTSERAHKLALECLEAYGDEFGDPAHDWSHAAARDQADEDMTEWEQAHGAN